MFKGVIEMSFEIEEGHEQEHGKRGSNQLQVEGYCLYMTSLHTPGLLE